ncbi:hypothetical protein NXW27_16400 [Phocaeicola dorei]|nr:hypothetical protein [Phocaeicola dorei]
MQLASCSHREIQKAPHSIWTKLGETPEKTLLQGIMQMLNGNYTEAENLLRKAKEAGLPQADENLKILHEIY